MNSIRLSRLSRTRTLVLALGLSAGLALFGACSKDDPVAPLPPTTLAPDFSLPDVNPNSTTASQNVSPRTMLGKISAWYFGHST